MRWIMALLMTALLIIVVLWPTRQPTTLELGGGATAGGAAPAPVEECRSPELEARREIIRNSISRVEMMLDRHERRRNLQFDCMQLRSRITALERALEVDRSRASVVQAVFESLDEKIELHKISSSGAHWKVAGLAPNDAILDSVMRSVKGRVDSSLPSVRYVAKNQAIGRFFLGFLSPQPRSGLPEPGIANLAAVPTLPDRSDTEGPCWNPIESEELAWRLAEARVAGTLGDTTLTQDKQEKQRLSERLEVLRDGLFRDPSSAQASGRGAAIAKLLEGAEAQVQVEPTGARRFHGVNTQAYRVMAQGELDEAISALETVSKAGAIVGRLEICRQGLPKANLNDAEPGDFDADCVWSDEITQVGKFAFRFDVHVLARREQGVKP